MSLRFFNRMLSLALFFAGYGFNAFSQGYTPKETSFFRVGDSIRVDAEFVFGKITMDSLGQPKSPDLIWLTDFLNLHKLVEVSICVHTDTHGSFEKNQERSQKQAESIRNWLTSKGIDQKRFAVSGWGESAPIFSEEVIDDYFRADRTKYDSLHAVNRRITVKIVEVQQLVNCDYRPAADVTLNQYYRQKSDVFRVNDRFRLDFIPVDEIPSVTESSRQKYEELVDFIRCNPSVIFAISVHSIEKEDYFENRIGTKLQAQRIVDLFVKEFGLSPDQFQVIGAGSDQPIIPDVVMDEFENDVVQKNKFNQLNTRVELVIAEIGAGN